MLNVCVVVISVKIEVRNNVGNFNGCKALRSLVSDMNV